MWNTTIFDNFKSLNVFKKKLKIFSSFYFKKLSRDKQLIIHNFITVMIKILLKSSLFDSIFFELRTKCNSQCTFCDFYKNDTNLYYDSFELYKKVVNELSK